MSKANFRDQHRQSAIVLALRGKVTAPPTGNTASASLFAIGIAAMVLLGSQIVVHGAGSTAEAGLTYTNIKVASEPWSIHVLKIDRSQKDLTFASAHAGTKVLSVSFVKDQAAGLPRELGRAVAAVNGDFYMRDNPSYAGDPRGLQIVNGELISSPDTVCVWFDPDGNPHLDDVKNEFHVTWPDGRKTPLALNQQRSGPPVLLPNVAVLFTPTYGLSTKVRASREFVLEKDGDSPWLPLQIGQTYRARIREISTNGNTRLAPDTMVLSLAPQTVNDLAPGAVLQISTATTPNLKGVKVAMGGGPAVVKEGKPAFTALSAPPEVARDWSQRSKYERHPRTAVGWSPTHFYLVIVDGRQPELSVGMKLAELGNFFVSLGCTEAMNLDGGKSAQMWLNGRIMNSPCQGEDTVASSLVVVRKPEAR
jgi:exopolysaccharide biosynthesis protein